MLDQQHRHTVLGAQFVDQPVQFAGFLSVQPGRRLVQHQQLGPGDHAAGDFQPPLLAVGQIASLAVGHGQQAEFFQPERRLFQSLRLGAAVLRSLEQSWQQPGFQQRVLRDQQIFDHGHALEQPHVLKGAHQPQPGDAVAGQAMERSPIQRHGPGGRSVETADAVEDGGLARPVGADDGENSVAMDREVDVIHCSKPPNRMLRSRTSNSGPAPGSTAGVEWGATLIATPPGAPATPDAAGPPAATLAAARSSSAPSPAQKLASGTH